jgi:hypothetical protein
MTANLYHSPIIKLAMQTVPNRVPISTETKLPEPELEIVSRMQAIALIETLGHGVDDPFVALPWA